MSIAIAAENAQTAGRETWANLQVTGHGDASVAGFARSISYNIGETVDFCVTGSATTIDIYRTGWYGGDGFRKWGTTTNTPTTQPELVTIGSSNGATSATAWSTTATWDIPEDAVSGLHLALIRSPGNAFYVTFVVRDDDAVADVVYKTSDSTWGAAYNHYGTKANINGRDVYGEGTGVGDITTRCYTGSYHRPVITRGTVSQTYWMACEMPLIRFLERNGYSVKYISCVDLDKTGVSLLVGKTKVFLSSGHDEYWSQNMRDAIESWRDVYFGLTIFMSGNEVFWRCEYTYNGDEAQMWVRKDTMPGPVGSGHQAGNAFIPGQWQGTWMDTRWPGRKDGALLTGTTFSGGMNGVFDYDVVIPKNPYGGIKVWGGSSLVDSDITLTRVLGFEADRLMPTQPDTSAVILAAYTRAAPGGLSDANGENYNVAGNIEWGIVAQRYAGGGATVGFGTCQWSWALDDTHDRGSGTTPSNDARQFVVNILNDFGAQPDTIMSGVTLQERNSLDVYGLDPDAPVFTVYTPVNDAGATLDILDSLGNSYLVYGKVA